MRKIMVLVLLVVVLFCITGCGRFFRYETAFRGKVIDAETGEPIEGVVALGTWRGFRPGNTYYYDAREAVTDKNGEFVIPGIGFCFFINRAFIQVFKAGYEYQIFSRDDYRYPNHRYRKNWLGWEGKKPIVKLKKLSMEERKKHGMPPYPPTKAPYDNIKNYLQEIYENRKKIGLRTSPPKTMWGVDKDE